MNQSEQQVVAYKSDIKIGTDIYLEIQIGGKLIELQANQDNSLEQIIQALLQSEQQKILQLNLKNVPIEKFLFRDFSTNKTQQTHSNEPKNQKLTKQTTLKDIGVYQAKFEQQKMNQQQAQEEQRQITKKIQIFWELEDSLGKQIQLNDNEQVLQDQQLAGQKQDKLNKKQQKERQDQSTRYINSKLNSEHDASDQAERENKGSKGEHHRQAHEQTGEQQLQIERQRQLQNQRKLQQNNHIQRNRLQQQQKNRKIFEPQNQRQVVVDSTAIEAANQAQAPDEAQKSQSALKSSSIQKGQNQEPQSLKKVQEEQATQISISIIIGKKEVELDVLMQHTFNEIIQSLIEVFSDLDEVDMDKIKVISVKNESKFIDKSKPMRQFIDTAGNRFKIMINDIQQKKYGTQQNQAKRKQESKVEIQSKNQNQKLIERKQVQEINEELKKSFHEPTGVLNAKNIRNKNKKEQQIQPINKCKCLIY